MAKHDENKVVVLLNRTGVKVNQATKTILAPKSMNIGNKRWGKIDFLVHYCGYTFVRNEDAFNNASEKTNKRKVKKEVDYKAKHQNKRKEA